MRKTLCSDLSILNPRSSILISRSCYSHQVLIATREDRRAQHLCQREVGEGGDEEHQQRLHVLRLQRVEQAAAPRADEGDVARTQGFFIHREMGAAAHQHHDVTVAGAALFAILHH